MLNKRFVIYINTICNLFSKIIWFIDFIYKKERKIFSPIYFIFGLSIISFLLFSCKSNVSNVKVLTDDVLIMDFANLFNLQKSTLKISPVLISEKTNVFEKTKDNFDMIIGNNNLMKDINTDKFYSLRNEIKKIEINSYFSVFYDYLSKNNYQFIPYGIDFYVIIVKKDKTNRNNFDLVDLGDFIEQMRPFNYYFSNQIHLSFTPLLSQTKDLDYFFIFNYTLSKNNNRLYFTSDQSEYLNNFLYNYDDIYNFGFEKSLKYIDTLENIPQYLYLKKDIILFDIIPISEALTLDKRTYKILLLKNLSYLSLIQKSISITKSSKHKKISFEFLEFILNKEIQEKMFNISYCKSFYLDSVHLPIAKDCNYFNDNLKQYIERLKSVDFIDSNSRKKFIESYNYSKEIMEKGLISREEFINFLNDQLAKNK